MYLTLCFAGVLFNMLLVATVFSNPKLRRGCHLLIVHCLLSFTAMSLISYPISDVNVYLRLRLVNGYDKRKWPCGFILWWQMTFRYASGWVNACVSANRFFAICLPRYYRTLSARNLNHSCHCFMDRRSAVCYTGSFRSRRPIRNGANGRLFT